MGEVGGTTWGRVRPTRSSWLPVNPKHMREPSPREQTRLRSPQITAARTQRATRLTHRLVNSKSNIISLIWGFKEVKPETRIPDEVIMGEKYLVKRIGSKIGLSNKGKGDGVETIFTFIQRGSLKHK